MLDTKRVIIVVISIILIVAIIGGVYFYLKNKGEEEEIIEDKGFFGRKNKIVSMPQPQSVKMVITQPTSFDQSDEICSYLKERKSIIVNLEYVNKDVARRIVDFLSGTIYAIKGNIQNVGTGIYLCTPNNINVQGKISQDSNDKDDEDNNVEW